MQQTAQCASGYTHTHIDKCHSCLSVMLLSAYNSHAQMFTMFAIAAEISLPVLRSSLFQLKRIVCIQKKSINPAAECDHSNSMPKPKPNNVYNLRNLFYSNVNAQHLVRIYFHLICCTRSRLQTLNLQDLEPGAHVIDESEM